MTIHAQEKVKTQQRPENTLNLHLKLKLEIAYNKKGKGKEKDTKRGAKAITLVHSISPNELGQRETWLCICVFKRNERTLPGSFPRHFPFCLHGHKENRKQF